jgi:uncharacterized protein YgiM (DUF1202 family)
MEGAILHFDRGSDQGYIRASDGKRYGFTFADWRSPGQPCFGDTVDFEPEDDRARAIFLLKAASGEVTPAPSPPPPPPQSTDAVVPVEAPLPSAAAPAPPPEWLDSAEPDLPFWRKPTGLGLIAALALLLLGLFWFNRFEWLGMERPGPEQVGVTGEQTSLFVVADANLRNKATAQGSAISGKVPRGTKVSGVMQMGEDGVSRWFKLADGRGFIGGVNLSVKEPPRLAKTFKDREWVPASDLELRTAPDAVSLILETIKPGSKLVLAGLTESGFAEVKLPKGGVGYFSADGIDLENNAAPPIGLTFDPSSCGFGKELDALFAAEFAAQSRREKELEAATYPDEEARQQASIDYDNKSVFKRISRSANTLSLSAVSVTNGASFVYFTNSVEDVVAAFRKMGFSIGADGVFNETDETGAYISGTTGDQLPYGKAVLFCGG